MNHYKASDGKVYSQSQIDARIRKAKKQKLENQILEFGYNFCETCKVSSGTYLDCSHDIAVKKGSIEQSFNIENISIRCRSCHETYGDGKI